MFDPRHPVLKQRLAGGRPFDMAWFALGSAAMVELAMRHPPGAAVIDLQHGLWDRLSLEAGLAAVPAGVAALARVRDNSVPAIGEALDAGAEGVVVPLVETEADAARAVAAAHFPPVGVRSGGGVRPLAAFADYVPAARAHGIVMLMIETSAGLANARAIAATEGVDAILIGTGDLGLSLGAEPGSAAHERACLAILADCTAAGTPCGIFTMDATSAVRRIEQGFRFAVSANDIGVIAGGFAAARSTMSAALEPPIPDKGRAAEKPAPRATSPRPVRR